MGSEIDAVISALHVELEEAERSNDYAWQVERSNRWIRQLPGGRLRFYNLHLYSDPYTDTVSRPRFITHVRATLAYLEAKRNIAAARPARWLGLFPSKTPVAPEDPVDAEFTDIPATPKKLPKPKVVK